MRSLLLTFLLVGCGLPAEGEAPATVPESVAAKPTPAPEPERSGVCGEGLATGPVGEALRLQGTSAGLEHPDAFAGVAWTVHQTGLLPDCYLRKREAEDKGWRRGAPVWETLPGKSIGGDRFGNREGLLPEPQPGGYVEADLDDDGGRRGAHRLVFAQRTQGRWDLWVTTDHYRSFVAVEAPVKITLLGSLPSLAAVHDVFAAQPEVPAWYGRNLDALWDVLTTEIADWTVEIADIAALRTGLGEDADRLLGLLLEAAAESPGATLVIRGPNPTRH